MQPTSHSKHFDPCSLFPARIKSKVWIAKARKKTGGVSGATDLIKRVAYLPTGNNAYDRTVRLHESLHAIYTPKPTEKRIKSKKPYTMLEQALEDARLHLVCAQTKGSVRRDELATALTDLRRGASGDKGLAALLALRSQAILLGGAESLSGRIVGSKLKALCASVSPAYYDSMMDALHHIERNELDKAAEILTPYFPKSDAMPESRAWPGAGKGDVKELESGVADVSFEKLEGELTSEAADMLSPSIADIVRKGNMPTLTIHQLFASAMIPTFFGETQKHMQSGMKIHAKKLAMIVGPSTPRLFLKTIRRNGGTVVIDASASMEISPEKLLKLVSRAPAATIAFYNAPSDNVLSDGKYWGNMWIFAHKEKRAADFSEVLGISDEWISQERRKFSWGTGNVVDFQVLQWLLAQPAPRYILTDGIFTGCWQTIEAGRELLRTAIARKKITQVTSMTEMEKILAKGRTQ